MIATTTSITYYISISGNSGRYSHEGYSKYHDRLRKKFDGYDIEVYGIEQAMDHANELRNKGINEPLVLLTETIVTTEIPLNI